MPPVSSVRSRRPGARSRPSRATASTSRSSWDDGLILHTHMRMTGSWHLYRAGEPWRRPYHQLRAAIETTDWVAVCFNAPIVETYRQLRPPPPSRPSARSGPTCARPTPISTSASTSLLHYPDQDADRRGAARPARDVRGRQRLPLRGAVGQRDEPVRARRRPRPTTTRSSSSSPRPRCCGARTVHGQADHDPDVRRWAGRVRTQRSALPAVRRHDRGAPHRRARPVAVLVPGLPDPRSTHAASTTARLDPHAAAPSCPTSRRAKYLAD